ncbi:MAG: hypothetical protein ACYTKD_17995 [Planctomycetota bacterium]|jgi:hypothetical protein
MPDRKTCTSCLSEIDARATVCPRCRRWQGSKVWRLAIPVAIMAMMTVVLILHYGMASRMTRRGEKFTENQAALRVDESEITFGEERCSDHTHEIVAVLGVLHNDSDIPWNEVVFEVSFYDEKNRLVDVTHDEDYDFHVPARASANFKVTHDREFPKEEYVSHKVRVLSAQNARVGF